MQNLGSRFMLVFVSFDLDSHEVDPVPTSSWQRMNSRFIEWQKIHEFFTINWTVYTREKINRTDNVNNESGKCNAIGFIVTRVRSYQDFKISNLFFKRRINSRKAERDNEKEGEGGVNGGVGDWFVSISNITVCLLQCGNKGQCMN